jgi:serine/threonine-protein kinase
MASATSNDRNLLFGVLALQLDFLSRDALVAGMNAWALDKTRPLGRILVEQGALSPARLELLDALVVEHLNKHDGDVSVSLAAAANGSTLSEALDAVADSEVLTTLTALGGPLRRIAPPVREGIRFRNLRPHAKGGLGQVFIADDVELNREVAVKEIQLHRADDPANRARFVREAEITGALEHPGVIPVYALGSHPDGRPYYAMRLVRGETLKVAIEQYHALPAADRPAELRRLLGRVIDVCNAIAYAHSRGVVHRDLKPANVLLGPFGETLVVDWGLAKAGLGRHAADDATTDPTIHPSSASGQPTRAGAAMGTPGYMSPEQAAGDPNVGPATDVFGLGAILYCLLTGRKPFEGTTVEDEVAQTRKGVFPSPREVNRDVPAPLDAVCRKALAREPADRYRTPLGLAADLERWLADEPVGVFRDPRPVRAGRWARRHRAPVAAVAVLLVAAAVGLGLGTALLWREERHTRHEYDRAEREHQSAERNFEMARTLVLKMGSRIETIEIGKADTRRSDLNWKAALDAARTQFERFVADNPDDLVLKSQLAALHRYAGNVARLTGDHAEAEACYKAALAIWDELARHDPADANYQDNLAQTLGDMASVQKRGGRLRESAATLDRAAALAEEVKDRVPPSSYQRTLATVLLDRADVEYRLGHVAAGERAAGRSVELYDALKAAPAHLAKPVDPNLAALAVLTRGASLRELGNQREALEVLDDALARAQVLQGTGNPRDVRHLLNKTRLTRAATRSRAKAAVADAVRELDQVVESADKLAADFPQTTLYKEVQGDALVWRGQLTAGSAPARAAADFERALTITRELIDKHGAQVDHIALRGRAYLGKGRLLLGQGNKPEAGTAFDLAVTVFRIASQKDPDNFHIRRGLQQAEDEARANPKSPKP